MPRSAWNRWRTRGGCFYKEGFGFLWLGFSRAVPTSSRYSLPPESVCDTILGIGTRSSSPAYYQWEQHVYGNIGKRWRKSVAGQRSAVAGQGPGDVSEPHSRDREGYRRPTGDCEAH